MNVTSPGWRERSDHSAVALPDGHIVLMGGTLSYRYGSIPVNDVWRSTDEGATWTEMNASAGWTPRYEQSAVALPDGSIVLMGGNDGNDATGGVRDDVWRSTDEGATWTVMNASARWAERALQSSVALPDGSIVLMGGQSGYGEYWDPGYNSLYNDTWRSTDGGATWTEMNASAPWPARNDISSVAMPDGSIVLIGGTNGSPPWYRDMWRSTDEGATWTQLPDAGWLPRYDESSVVTPNGTIVLTGGFTNWADGFGYQNDVWSLSTAGSSDQTPSHTYTMPGTYSVTLQASNAYGYNSTQKTGYIIATGSAPVAGFSATPTSGTAPLVVQFNDTSTGSPTSWNWSFGDGKWFNTTDAASSNVTHVYWNSGSPAAYLLVTNSGGSSTSSSQTITVSPAFTGPAAMYRAYPNRNGTCLNGGIMPTGTLKWVNASSNATIGGMKSSPAVADGVVYIGSNDGNITAWNATTGVMLWSFTTSNAVRSSPAVANGIVYVSSADWSPNTNLYALDAATGHEVWNYSIWGEGSSPAVVDGVLYITELGGNVYALNAANGELLWTDATYLMGMGSSPAVVNGSVNGTVFITGGSFNPDSTTVFALKAKDGTMRWQQTYDGHTQSTPAVSGGILFLTRGYNLTALDPKDGTILWSNVTDTDPTATILSSPAVAGSRVYVGSNDGNIYALDAATGIKLWNFTTGDAIWSSPAVADGVVYVGSNDDNVYALDAATGAKLWNYTTGGHVESCPVIDNGTVYVGSDDGNIYAIGSGLSPAPVPGFTATVTSGAAPLPVTFTDTSTVLAGTMWNWSFGDSTWFNATVSSNPDHTYTMPGTYTVTLTVTNASGSSTATQAGYIHVTSGAQPFAAFSGTPTTGQAPLTVTFTDQSTGSPTGWAWFFGDENYTEPWTEVNASAGWTPREGQSSVATPDGSIVLMGGSTTDIMNSLNNVWSSKDDGATWTEANASAGWLPRVVFSSVVMPDGSIVLMGGNNLQSNTNNYLNDTWRSTDEGVTWTEVNTSAGWLPRVAQSSVVMPDGSIVLMGGYHYPSLPDYLDDVWRSTDNGATWTEINASPGWSARKYSSSVVMPDGSIVLMGGWDSSGYKNDTWRSTDEGATWTEVNASAGWLARYGQRSSMMPDGSIILTGGANSGSLNDTWRSTDKGATWTEVNASARWPARDYTTSAAMPDGSIVLMGGLGSSNNPLNDVWRFSPVGSSDQSPSHIYTTPGIYNVTLQVYNSGGYNSTQKVGYITAAIRPVTSFTANRTHGIVPVTVQFMDTSGGSPTEWNWSFGDGTFSLLQNPVHMYTGIGTYTVSLNATNGWGSTMATVTDYIIVNGPKPIPDFSANVTLGPPPLPVSFIDQSSNTPTGWAWFFGDENYAGPWTEVNASAGWSPRGFQSSVVMPDGSIILMGGELGATGAPNYNDTWRSTDEGETWTQLTASAPWLARWESSSVVMPDGSIVLMGGQGNSGFYNDVWRSTDDGTTWIEVNASAGWSPRSGQNTVVTPDGSIALMGGWDGTNYYNDVWRSTNEGATWTEVNASAGWTARHYQSSVATPDGSIVLMGGSTNFAVTGAMNDVWRSTDDGTTWMEVNASAGWLPRVAQSSVVMPDGSIVLTGGQLSAGTCGNDIWRSVDDGATWTQMIPSAVWPVRAAQNSVVMPDGSIVLTGGYGSYSSPYYNDVWRFMPAGSSAQNPSHTYTSTGTYQVAFQAYNAGGYNSTKKTGYVTITTAVNWVWPGKTVFTGESGLDISACMAGNTTIAWWPAGADITSTAPATTISVGSTVHNFAVTPAQFAGYTGPWYSYDGLPGTPLPALQVANPTVDVTIRDISTGGTDVTGQDRAGWRRAGI